jgi:hypothetical protein
VARNFQRIEGLITPALVLVGLGLLAPFVAKLVGWLPGAGVEVYFIAIFGACFLSVALLAGPETKRDIGAKLLFWL